jgi:hypothetical protein
VSAIHDCASCSWLEFEGEATGLYGLTPERLSSPPMCRWPIHMVASAPVAGDEVGASVCRGPGATVPSWRIAAVDTVRKEFVPPPL